jgi:signal transduction histidine kinase
MAPPTRTGTEQRAARPRGRELLRAVAEGTAGAVGDEFLRSLTRHLAGAFDAKLAFVAESVGPDGRRARFLAGWLDGGPIEEPIEYDTDGQPCALLAEQAVLAIPEALTTRFPADQTAIELGLESYLAVCLRAADGTHLGHLAVLDGRPMEIDDDDVAALRIFAARAAAELERRRQETALQTSRQRIVEIADDERRRFGRDLHDGAQQRLLGVSNLLRVARGTLGDDAQAHDLLEAAGRELAQAHAELRELARGLHPVALSERGLADVLGSLAVHAPVAVDLKVTEAPVPDHAALAAYFLVAESLSNAGKHARATSVRVRVAVKGEELHVEVADDGAGGADATAGTGLRGLQDRMHALGGHLSVHSPAGGGTRVSGVMPVGDR